MNVSFLEFDDIMHQFYHAVRISEGEESVETGKPDVVLTCLFVC